MLRSKLLGLARRMEGIAETHQARDAPFSQQLVRQQAGHASAHGLPANDEDLTVFHLGTDLLDRCAILWNEGFRLRRRLSLATGAPSCHVAELEAGDGNAAGGEQICYRLQEWGCHWSAC